jgi:site-specific DNA-methyltransferase (adenine-specific)
VDAVVTDPPYTAAGGNTNGRTSAADHQYWRFWFAAVWDAVARVATDDAFAMVFSDWRMIGTLAASVRGGIDRQTASDWEVTQAIVWDRGSIGLGAPYRNSFEMIGFLRAKKWKQKAFFPKDIPTVIKCYWPYGRHENHGAEKPVKLIEELIVPHAPSAILDPFMGGGTTGVACIRTGRRFIGIEIDPGHYQIAKRRIEAELAQSRPWA